MAYSTPYQLKFSIAIKPSSTLTERIRERGETTNFADPLDEPTDKVLDVFTRQPSGNDLHIIVELPATSEFRLHFTLLNYVHDVVSSLHLRFFFHALSLSFVTVPRRTVPAIFSPVVLPPHNAFSTCT